MKNYTLKNYLKSVYTLIMALLIFTSNTEASLSAHPGVITDTIYAGRINTSVLHITNLGPASYLDYLLSSDASWITFSTTYGSINQGDSITVDIIYDVSFLQSGINSSNIYIGDPHHGPITIPVEIYFQSATDVKEEFSLGSPFSFSLNQNFPNPFNPMTKIIYSIPEAQKVVVKVYNVLGNEIMTLVNGEKPKGNYTINLDLAGYPSGVYFYKIKTEKFARTRKMVLTK